MTERLYLGVAQTDITPAVGGHLFGYNDTTFSESVHDRLEATAFAFRQGGVSALIIGLTVAEIHDALSDELRRDAAALTGVPFENILVNATHTHSAPNVSGMVGWGDVDRPYYESILRPQTAEAVKRAWNGMVPVRMGIGRGLSFVGINRRRIMPDNTVALGQNPWGCFNPAMTILSFRADDGTTVANIVHYGCHGTAAGCNHEISRDWSGIMTDRLKALSGGITALLNGPEGDVGPRLTNGKTVGDISYVEELGGVAAADAVRVFGTIREFYDVDLAAGTREITVPYAPRIPQAEAERELARWQSETVNIAGQRASYYRQVVESYANGYVEKEGKKLPQTVVRLGGAAFVSFPYELFSEIGMRIEETCPLPYVLSLSNTNGSAGYFPTQDQLCRGGYEIDMFRTAGVQVFRDDADFALVNETLGTIEYVG